MASEDEDDLSFDERMQIPEIRLTDTEDEDDEDNPADEDYVDIATDSDEDEDGDASDVDVEPAATNSTTDYRTNSSIADEEEDDVIKAILAATKAPRTHPPDITTEDFVIDLSFHPDKDILAAGTITGRQKKTKFLDNLGAISNQFICFLFSHL